MKKFKKLIGGQGEDYAAELFLDYEYFKDHYI